MTTIAQLEQRLNELESLIRTYATRQYVETYIATYFGTIHRPIYNGESLLSGYEPFNLDTILVHARNTMIQYNSTDWRNILVAYDNTCKQANINPYLVVAQMLKETNWLRSEWSNRPYRNPAGLGVTGETASTQVSHEWQKLKDGLWHRGLAFDSWEISCKAHIGHVLCYMYTDDQLNEDQKHIVHFDPRATYITQRGIIKKLNDLDGHWNAGITGYGQSIAALANIIRS